MYKILDIDFYDAWLANPPVDLALEDKTLKVLSFPLFPHLSGPWWICKQNFLPISSDPDPVQIPDSTSRPSGRVSGHVRTGALRTATGHRSTQPNAIAC